MDRGSLYPQRWRRRRLEDLVFVFGALMDRFELMGLFEAVRQGSRKH